MRAVDYRYNQDAAGGMSFRLSLPLGTTYATERHAPTASSAT